MAEIMTTSHDKLTWTSIELSVFCHIRIASKSETKFDVKCYDFRNVRIET